LPQIRLARNGDRLDSQRDDWVYYKRRIKPKGADITAHSPIERKLLKRRARCAKRRELPNGAKC
jgi:hypothetical protein